MATREPLRGPGDDLAGTALKRGVAIFPLTATSKTRVIDVKPTIKARGRAANGIKHQ